jgi:hypothetical protein
MGTDSLTAMGESSHDSLRHRAISVVLLVAAAGCYVGIVTIRQGPPSGGDTVPLVAVTTDLASGQLHAAASEAALPNPPGYGLLTAPLVWALRPLVGSSNWCTTTTRAASLRLEPAFQHDPTFAEDVGECGSLARRANGTTGDPLPPWYRSQGVLGLLAWLVLAVGSLELLSAGASSTPGRQVGLLAFLAFLPAASSAVVQLYHPQDIVSLGLGLVGLAQTLRRRWVLAGALFGAAFLTKQFAVLLLVPALAAAPGMVERLRMAIAATVVFAAGLLPFLASDPRATLDNLSGFSAGGAVAGSTVLSLAGVSGGGASAVARDAPVIFAVVVCLWARRRLGPMLGRPQALVALALACVGSRLVFESVIFPYYLLAASVLFFMLDLVARRCPYLSLAWCAAAAFFVAFRPGSPAVGAIGTLLLALAAVGAGLADLYRSGPTVGVRLTGT